jgi:hypothetical protein
MGVIHLIQNGFLRDRRGKFRPKWAFVGKCRHSGGSPFSSKPGSATPEADSKNGFASGTATRKGRARFHAQRRGAFPFRGGDVPLFTMSNSRVQFCWSYSTKQELCQELFPIRIVLQPSPEIPEEPFSAPQEGHAAGNEGATASDEGGSSSRPDDPAVSAACPTGP